MNIKNDGFFLQLTDIEDGNTNVLLQIDNYKNALIINAHSYNKTTKREARTEFRKDVKRKLSLKELQKIHDNFSKMKKIQDIKNYIGRLNLSPC
jgi:hypothetical protein